MGFRFSAVGIIDTFKLESHVRRHAQQLEETVLGSPSQSCYLGVNFYVIVTLTFV